MAWFLVHNKYVVLAKYKIVVAGRRRSALARCITTIQTAFSGAGPATGRGKLDNKRWRSMLVNYFPESARLWL